ncbi:MAG: beta-ketoacyl synthase N-terminal-like domain-containing protein, partial [Chthoniobacteraceae bacterium]|nr:beta-ketoacyl synthase N-terminal-like domain-containing protein [Chthoniobacteraceae bacterium]
MSISRRVVITGMGVASPVGSDLHAFWDNLTHGRSGIARITLFDTTGYDCQIGGEVKNFEPANWFKTPKDSKRADRFAQLGMAAAKLAMDDAGLQGAPGNPERFGVIIGSGIGGLKSLADQHANLITKGPGRISPFM